MYKTFIVLEDTNVFENISINNFQIVTKIDFWKKKYIFYNILSLSFFKVVYSLMTTYISYK